MIRGVFYVCLCFIVLRVTAKPVQLFPVQQYPVQQHYNNPGYIPFTYQEAAQSSPYTQSVTVQNQPSQNHESQPSVQGNFENTLDNILMSKILSNPNLQKILNPNTKLYNRKGVEIQRQSNTVADTAPNVINNYFIVPPEFFKVNETNTNTEGQQVNGLKRANTKHARKNKKAKVKKSLNDIRRNQDETLLDKEHYIKNDDTGTRERSKRKKNKNKIAVKTADHEVQVREKNSEEELEVEDGKLEQQKIRKQQVSRNSNGKERLKIPTIYSEESSLKDENILQPASKKTKKFRKTTTKAKLEQEELPKIRGNNQVNVEDSSLNNQKGASTTDVYKIKDSKFKEKNYEVVEKDPEPTGHLKNIEAPVDNREQITNPTESRQTRNPKKEKVRNEFRQSNAPVPDDIFKNFFPYSYGNFNFPPDSYPFNFDQFYQQPHPNRANKRTKKRKNGTAQNQKNNDDSLSKKAEVQKTPKQEDTTIQPKIIKITEEPSENMVSKNLQPETTKIIKKPSENKSIDVIIGPTEPITNIFMEKPLKVSPVAQEIELQEPFSSKQITKENLQMPVSELIEDLHEYITPELGREDILPTINGNGIINDYFPVFNDDSYYASDDSLYLTELEDDRFYYTTDKSYEEGLNRERRKYDRNFDFNHVPNFNIKDQINYRRGYKSNGRDGLRNRFKEHEEVTIQKPYTEDHFSSEVISSNPRKVTHEELQFQTPPTLENPDFKTKKIEITPKSLEQDYSRELFYDKEALYTIHIPQLNERVKPNSEVERIKVLPKNVMPKSDNVETVYAKSKVVKYGVPKEEPHEDSSTSMPVYDDEGEGKSFNDDHTTFVVAKSVGPADDFYWKNV